jgi:hypothetical protein
VQHLQLGVFGCDLPQAEALRLQPEQDTRISVAIKYSSIISPTPKPPPTDITTTRCHHYLCTSSSSNSGTARDAAPCLSVCCSVGATAPTTLFT